MSIQRVILISPGFTADEYDHNCLPTLQLYVMELLRQQVEVHIVALDYPFSNFPYQWHGASVYPCGGRNSRWLKPRTLLRAVNICKRLLTLQRNTVIHSFWLGWASGIGEYVSRKIGIQHITTLMGQDVLPPNRHRFRFLSSERQNRLVVLSDFQNDVLEKHSGFRAAHVIPWGVSEAEIPPDLSAHRAIDVLGVGSLTPLKNWDLWLETIALLAKTSPGLRAELIGSGPERSRLEQLTVQLGLTQIVTFIGDLSRPQVLGKMQSAKCLLHTSHFESQGYVLAEAAMNGCQVIGTPVGIASAMGSCATTATALAELVADGFSKEYLATIRAPFLMSDTVDAYMQLYESGL